MTKENTMSYNWKWFRAGRMDQVSLTCGADIAALAELDRKQWIAISMPTTGVRFDARMLELMDSDHDGRIRTPEVLAAIDFLKSKNVDFDSLFSSDEAEEKALADVTAKQADLAKLEPSADDKKALAAWEAKGKTPEVAVAGDATADADAALAAVEPIVDAFFLPPEDMPLVTEEADKVLPLRDHLNPKHLEAILAFAEKCVKPVLGEKDCLSRMERKKVKGASGYEVKVGAKTYTIKKASTLKKAVKIAKAKWGKKVKVQVRAFKKIGTNTLFAPWSKAKSVKVKK